MIKHVFSKGLEQLDEVLQTVEDALLSVNFPSKTIFLVKLATEEIYCNIVKYAYVDGKSDVQLSYTISENPLSIKIRFLDCGAPFNPLCVEEPDLSTDAQDRPLGGLGIFLVKKSMDEVNYRYHNGNNILTLKKNA